MIFLVDLWLYGIKVSVACIAYFSVRRKRCCASTVLTLKNLPEGGEKFKPWLKQVQNQCIRHTVKVELNTCFIRIISETDKLWYVMFMPFL